MAPKKPQLDLFGGAAAAAPAASAEPVSQPEASPVRSARRRRTATAPADPAPSPALPLVPMAAEPKPEVPAEAHRPEGTAAGTRREEAGAAVRAAIRARLAGETPVRAESPPAAPRVLSVRELASQIKGSLEDRFGVVHVRGEISNLRQPGSGHLYFSLKDDGACLRAVLFRGQARLLRFRVENGQEVVARGRVSFYDQGGDTQIVCDSLEPVGLGALAVAFEQRKAKLAAEGLFDPSRKRPLPFLPLRIGVVTSPTGAAIRDFLRVLHRRFAGISVLVAPARVQGDGAAEEIAAGVRRLGARGDLDVIVVTRGGGSIEDLWAFNEEVVARAIAAAPVPVVSAVGHEVDFTIADFVADLRAPTPTGAAELLAPVELDLRSGLSVARSRLARAMHRIAERHRASVHRQRARLGDPRRSLGDARIRLDDARHRAAAILRRRHGADRRELRELQERLRRAHPAVLLRERMRELSSLRERLRRAGERLTTEPRDELEGLRATLVRRSPGERILREGRRLGETWGRLETLVQRQLAGERARASDLGSQLRALSPLRVLARGYAVAFAASGAVLLSARDARPGERLQLELADGALSVDVVGPAPERKARIEGGSEASGTEVISPFDRGGGGR